MQAQTLIVEIMNNKALNNAIENLTMKEFDTLPEIIKIEFCKRSVKKAMKEAEKDLMEGNVLSAKEWIEKAEFFSREIKSLFS